MFVNFCLAKLWMTATPHIRELCLLFKIEEKEKRGLNSQEPNSDGMRYMPIGGCLMLVQLWVVKSNNRSFCFS